MTEGDAIRLAIALIAGIVVIVTDLREHRIPNRVTFPAAAAVIASAATETVWRLLANAGTGIGDDPGAAGAASAAFSLADALAPAALTVLGAVASGAALFVLAWFGTLGFGDVKLAIVLGAALLPAFGWPSLGLAFMLSYLFSFPHAVALLIIRRRRGGPGDLALGPYLVAAALVAGLVGFASGASS